MSNDMVTNEYTSKKNEWLLILVFLLQTLDNLFRDRNLEISFLSSLKTVVIVIVMIIFLSEIYLGKKKNSLIFKKQLCDITLMYLFLLVISFINMFRIVSYNWSPLTFGFLRIVIPILFAFLALNVMNFKEIYSSLTIFLVVGFILFVLNEISLGNFSFTSIFTFSLSNSEGSLMESNYFSPMAVSLCLFFGYYRKSKWRLLLSVLFTIMTYKRLMTLLALFLLFFGEMVRHKKISKIMLFFSGMLFLALSIYYVKMNLGLVNTNLIYRYFGIDLDQLNMGRTWMFQNVYLSGYEHHGLFSIINSGLRNPEMDLLNMFLEMGWISIVCVIIFMLLLVSNSFYIFIAVMFTLFEMLTSHWLDILFYWIIFYITIGCIYYNYGRDY